MITRDMMVRNFLDAQAARAVVDVEPVVRRLATCPLCFTTNVSVTTDALAAGGGWQCARCGQRWDACRLAVVAAYVACALESGTPFESQPATLPSAVARVAKVLPFAATRSGQAREE